MPITEEFRKNSL